MTGLGALDSRSLRLRTAGATAIVVIRGCVNRWASRDGDIQPQPEIESGSVAPGMNGACFVQQLSGGDSRAR
ncbi:MAG: hypothetical protein ACI835_005144 [Planctomycetota bacterium]|jgi:hypothetical protein